MKLKELHSNYIKECDTYWNLSIKIKYLIEYLEKQKRIKIYRNKHELTFYNTNIDSKNFTVFSRGGMYEYEDINYWGSIKWGKTRGDEIIENYAHIYSLITDQNEIDEILDFEVELNSESITLRKLMNDWKLIKNSDKKNRDKFFNVVKYLFKEKNIKVKVCDELTFYDMQLSDNFVIFTGDIIRCNVNEFKNEFKKDNVVIYRKITDENRINELLNFEIETEEINIIDNLFN